MKARHLTKAQGPKVLLGAQNPAHYAHCALKYTEIQSPKSYWTYKTLICAHKIEIQAPKSYKRNTTLSTKHSKHRMLQIATQYK